MLCEDVQDLASAWLDRELSETRARAVEAHMETCASCQAYTADLRILAAEMAHLGREPAPPGLEARIRAALAEESGRAVIPFTRPGRWRGAVRQAASLAAVCLLSVFGTWAVVHQPDGPPVAGRDAVAAHMRSLLADSPIQVVSSDSHTVRPWFAGKVEFAPPVKDLTAEGFPLIGGRLDFVDGHRVAALVYRHGPHTVSVFVWPDGADAAAKASRVSGLNLLTWTRDGMVWWAVSDLNPDELRELRALL